MPVTRSRSRARHSYDVALLSFSGLGEISAHELGLGRSKFKSVRVRDYDLVTASIDAAALESLAQLKTVEDVFVQLGRPLRVQSRSDLRKLRHAVTRSSILAALEVKNRAFPALRSRRRQITFKCFVKQDRDYHIRRAEIESEVEGALARAFPGWRVADPAALELWAFYAKGTLYLGLRLSSASMRYHGRKPARRAATLRPTIASALVLLADIEEGERVIDPMCGTGTLVSEVLDLRVASHVMGGDIDPDAISFAGGVQSDTSSVLQWDCSALPLASSTIDCVVCNLPFGRKYLKPEDLPETYGRFLAEWRRVLVPEGRMVLLTSERQAIERAAAQAGLRIARRANVKVLGLSASIYRIASPRSSAP